MEEITKHQLGKEHTTERPKLLSGNEPFRQNGVELGFNVMDYWRFQFYNLADNLGFKLAFCAYGGCVTKDNKTQYYQLPRVYFRES